MNPLRAINKNQLEGRIVGYGENQRPMTWDDLARSKQECREVRKNLEEVFRKYRIEEATTEWAKRAILDAVGLFRRLRPLPVPKSCDGPSPDSKKVVPFAQPAA